MRNGPIINGGGSVFFLYLFIENYQIDICPAESNSHLNRCGWMSVCAFAKVGLPMKLCVSGWKIFENILFFFCQLWIKIIHSFFNVTNCSKVISACHFTWAALCKQSKIVCCSRESQLDQTSFFQLSIDLQLKWKFHLPFFDL